jgi:hypothetical protein
MSIVGNIEMNNVVESEEIIILQNKLTTLNSLQSGTRIIFILSIIPAIVLLKRYKNRTGLMLWIASFMISSSAFISTITFGVTGNETPGAYYKSGIIIALIRIIAKLIPLVYSCIKLITNIRKDKLNKTSKGEN